jgi:LuxR family maltose regulon positive regulatory protein
MASPLVRTKLFIPRLRRGVVPRSRLSERLDDGAETKLTLVSAPAGFGKTTPVAAWLHRAVGNRSAAWLSLEHSDREPTVFWTYLINAVRTVVPDLGDGVLPLLRSAQPPMETVLATVVNELGAVPDDLIVVLDDYHLADGPGVAGGMAFLLEHLPPQVHLVLTTRVETRTCRWPACARGASWSRCGRPTSASPPRRCRSTSARRPAWTSPIATPRLSRAGPRAGPRPCSWPPCRCAGGRTSPASSRASPATTATSSTTSSRRSWPASRTRCAGFLVQTSVLDRLTGDLCDAVTGQAGGRTMLESLDRANLFLVPLDDSRRWYRYHHLFADVLQMHLRDEQPERVAALHRRAARWYGVAGEPSPAVRHALAAGDVEGAADLMERFVPVLQPDRQEAIISSWLDELPDEVVRARPVLAVGFVGALMTRREYDDVPARLRDVERWLESTGPAAVHEPELARLPAMVELYWTGLALVAGDTAGTHRHAHRAIERAAPGDHVTPAGASALSALASWGAGDLEAAHRGYTTCVAGLRRAGHVSDVLGCSITLADIRITQGRLGAALATYESALRLASAEPARVRGTADMYAGLSEIALERGDLLSAEDHLRRAQDLGEPLGLPQYPYRWRVAMARVRQADGDLAGALELVEAAERVYTGDYSPDVRPVPALRARLLALHGGVDAALG